MSFRRIGGIVGRLAPVVLLYALAALAAFLAFGYAVSDPMPNLEKADLLNWSLLLLAGSLALVWVAGTLWIGRLSDGLVRRASGRVSPRTAAAALALLAIAACLPLVLRLVFGELRDLWELGLAASMAPPAAILAALRLFKPSLKSAS